MYHSCTWGLVPVLVAGGSRQFASDGSCTTGDPEVGAQSSDRLPETAVETANGGSPCLIGHEDPVSTARTSARRGALAPSHASGPSPCSLMTNIKAQTSR
ncbi:hypothetical protein BDY19DRAFT_998289 [Irpex rosettiformis]|uniref:Uncharacterized protein n=1 Tax=Irpex rosettiformis TaxID=378272 RepID=A0ACB8TPU7_9APHY|nr:hypothetical protein BDY19DRAFT_998289 [Irpex rosettiformis]